MKNITKEDKYLWSKNKNAFCSGIKDGVPIGLGYLAVSFSLGIAAKNAGFTPFQGFLVSILCNASAGEYAGITLVAAGASLLEIAVVTLITNARYILMSCALSQRMAEDTPLHHRLLMSYDIADELFGITIAREGLINPYYTYGAVLFAAPCWAFGTALGVAAGNIMPLRLVSAFSVALYGMFLAVIIPPSRKNKVILALVIISFIASLLTSNLSLFSNISMGTRTIILTLLISGAAAIFFPRKEGEE